MAKFEAQISFKMEDLKENPNASLSKICGEWLWENKVDALSVSDLFVLQKIPGVGLKADQRLQALYWKSVESARREKSGGKGEAENSPRHSQVFRPFSAEYTYELYGNLSKAVFLFLKDWNYVGVVISTVKNKKIVKSTESYWLDFFDEFSKGVTQEDCASFEGILNNVVAHHRKVWERA